MVELQTLYICIYFALGFGSWLGWCLGRNWDQSCRNPLRLALLLTLWPFVILVCVWPDPEGDPRDRF